jgi:hypothetical protein
MNIILLNKRLVFLPFLICFIPILSAQNAKSDKKNFAVSAEFGSGYIANIDLEKSFSENIFFSPSARLLWKPNHKLNIGFESSYITVSKLDSTLQSTPFGSTILKARLNAIPMLLVFNMKIAKIDLYYGIGVSYVTSRLEAFEEKVVVSNWYYCYDIALAYNHPLTKNLDIGIESKTYFFPKLQKVSSGLTINFSYRFLRW